MFLSFSLFLYVLGLFVSMFSLYFHSFICRFVVFLFTFISSAKTCNKQGYNYYIWNLLFNWIHLLLPNISKSLQNFMFFSLLQFIYFLFNSHFYVVPFILKCPKNLLFLIIRQTHQFTSKLCLVCSTNKTCSWFYYI